jgi:NitT/TauT family transport system permease protein
MSSASSSEAAPRGSAWVWLGRAALQILPAILLFVFVIGVWEQLSHSGHIARIVLPAPSSIWDSLWLLMHEPFFWSNFGTTMKETFIGYALGVGGGFLLGVITAVSPLSRRMIMPYAVLIESLPKIILAPLTLIWFGYGISSKVALIVLIVFFPVYLNTMTGLANTSSDELDLMRACQASRMQTFWRVQLPNALPNIFVGVKNGLVGAFIGAIVSEFIGARAGLGVLVKTYNEQLRIDYVYAVIVVLALLSLIFFLLLEVLDRQVIYWRNRN